MNWCDMRLWCWLMPGYSARGKRMNADTLRWPFMYFPTSPDRLARPLGKRVFADTRRRCGVHTYPPATPLPLATSAFHVKAGEYLAPLGQMGEHVSLRQHAGRPPYAIEFLADGWPQKAMPVFSPHGFKLLGVFRQ